MSSSLNAFYPGVVATAPTNSTNSVTITIAALSMTTGLAAPMFQIPDPPAVGASVLVTFTGAGTPVYLPGATTNLPGVPYATAAGQITIHSISGVGTSYSLSFPAGRFTSYVQPVVQVSVQGGTPFAGFVTGFNADPSTGCTIGIQQVGASSFTGDRTAVWTATQMTPSAAAG